MYTERKASYSEPVYDNVDWAGKEEEKYCFVCLGCTLGWGQMYEFIKSLDVKPQGMMK
jgi:hypothetical protein